MAYSGREARYQEGQYQTRPQGYEAQYSGRQARYQEGHYQARPQGYKAQHNGYDQGQYEYGSAGYQAQYDQQQRGYQQDAYASNQQYSQNYDPEWEQYGNNQAQYPQDVNHYQYAQAGREQQEQQPRQYQYDDRYRTNGHGVQQQGNTGRRSADGRPSPQVSRPGTSASHRRMKQERILDNASHNSPKAIPWDNPFGAFPGTRKDAEKKKKEADEARSASKVDAPIARPATSSSSRAPTFDQNPAANSVTKTSLEEPRRPSTSHAQRPQPPQEQTSYLNQPLGPLDDMPLRKKPTPQPEPQRNQQAQNFQQPPSANPNGRVGLPARPAPQRSATGPHTDGQYVPSRNVPTSPENHRIDAQGQHPYPDVGSQGVYHEHRDVARERQYDHPNGQPQAGYNDRYRPAAAELDARVERPHPHEQQYGQDDRNEFVPRDHGELAYRGVQPTAPLPSTTEPAMPNFAAIAPGVTENVEKDVTLQQTAPTLAYRKPTYGDSASKPPPIRPGLVATPVQHPSDNFVQSPVGDFDFGLPASQSMPALTPQTSQAMQPNVGYESRNGQQPQPVPDATQQRRAPPQQQFPPRSGSRPDMRNQQISNGFPHPYNQPMASRQQVTVHQQRPMEPEYAESYDQPRRAPRQDYEFGGRGHQQGNDHNDPHQENGYQRTAYNDDSYQHVQPLARTYTEPVNQYGSEHHQDHYNHGYNQRAQPGRNNGYVSNQYSADPYQQRGAPEQYNNQGPDPYVNATPVRPRTANSARAPIRQYPEQNIPGSRPPNPTFPTGDRNHPVPVRPGLMAPAEAPTPAPAPGPSPAPQVSPPREQQAQRPSGPSQQPGPPRKNPVTIQELNDLRVAFKDRPNDDKLGLKFAKRLGEAAMVLANEGGKADAKTTARNRERYINDAYKIIKKLVAGGSQDAMFYLADCYGQGSLGLEVNPKEAFQLYTSAAKMGHAQSAYRVAVCCELGQDGGGGTRRDHVKAVQFYKRAATLGDGPAMFKLGMILLKGLLGQQPNRREGVSWLKRAAERADEENPHALHELALLYESAQSTDVIIRDERYALQLFNQAANLGYKYSQHRLGSAYEYGMLGVQIDPRQSIAWYSRAAQQGEHQSEFALSGWYLTGSEPLLAQSDTEAYLWARKAAASGLAKAEYAMGYYTEVGIGCQPSLEEAKKWYFRAAAQLDNRAKERLEEIKKGGARKEKTRVTRSHNGRQNEGECTVM
ncbi:hypothetical protein PMZ80_002121 [Knufia obscura]|uniref:Uncharacterized protein n=1 Tax=Knufia obscura TaxID=1635080 RepID=A0ABR0RXV1_9EURO|nr:hypothetical protein PMZ80_002121 [Knufia obscura]